MAAVTIGTRVRVHGGLAQELGREEWQFLIERPREAVAALEANTGKLYKYLRAHKQTEYRFVINGKDLMPFEGDIPQELYLSGQFESIDIIPVPAGSGGGIWQTIIGVVLLIVGVVLIIYGFQPLGLLVAGLGLSLIAGGISQMISPSPKLGLGATSRTFKDESDEKTPNKPNYLFSGIVNTIGQGGPVPICYGEMFIGSQLVSIGIHGGTISGATVGSVNPPPEDSAFYDDPKWDTLAAQPRAATVADHRDVRQLTKPEVATIALTFDLPTIWPASFHDAGRAIPNTDLRDFLYTLSAMFNHDLDEIGIKEVKRLYRVLELTSIPDPGLTPPGTGLLQAGWKVVMNAVGDYYVANP